MLFDNHVHTEFSADSEMTAEEALRFAAGRDLGLVFTEHYDCAYPEAIDFTFDPEAYWKKYEPLRSENLRLGVEIGMCSNDEQQNLAFIAQAPFDMVIGSIHLLDGQDIYYKEFYEGREKPAVYQHYFALMASLLRTHAFVDVLGHIDYIARYAPYENPELSYANFSEKIDAVLQAAVDTDTVMELNTRRLKSRLARKELMPIYRRYRELGGRYVTLGSDAHTADAIGNSFSEAAEMTEACGLQLVTFCQRKLEMVKF